MSEGIDTSGLDKLQRAINELHGPALLRFKGRATYFVAVALKDMFKRRPAGSHSPVKWASRKQQAFYHWMRRKAGLPLKYTRGSDPMSQRSGASWAISRQADSATLGNRATYSPYVVSSQYQTEQHKATGWQTDQQIADRAMADGTIRRIIEANIATIVREAFRGL